MTRDIFSILVVDDDPAHRDVMKTILSASGYHVTTSPSAEEALAFMGKSSVDLVLSDLMMGGMDGLALLAAIRENHPATEVILITGYGSIETAVKAMKKGARTYFIKGHDPEELLLEIKNLKEYLRLKRENELLQTRLSGGSLLMETRSPAMRRLFDIVQRAADSDVSLLILGESGVGKEVVARHIHGLSKRRNETFMAINCNAISGGLLESELFGHEKGAFTGATERRKGRLEEADNGTLFLDEIGEMPPEVQVTLLRALESRCFERIGSNTSIPTDFRLLSATNRDLTSAIAKGAFREDLYYRISSITVEVPPLRKRAEDLPMLIDHFIGQSQALLGKKIHTVDDSVMGFLKSHPYPGNIRELKNIINRLVVLSDGGRIRGRDLPEPMEIPASQEADEILSLKEIRKRAEIEHIEKALLKSNHNITQAAKLLGISRRQLFNKLNDYNLK